MSDAEFENIYSSFLEQVQRYNSDQRMEICEKTKEALVQILTSMPNPKSEENNISTMSSEAMKALIVLEMHIAEQMAQQNILNEKVFSRFDQNNSGKILPDQFRTVINLLEIRLSDIELVLLTQKFGGETQDGKICYQDFLQYVKAKRQISLGTIGQTTPHRLKATPKKQNPIMIGLQKVRHEMRHQSKNLQNLFQRLENGSNLVSISHLISELPTMGFPKNISENDISTEARIYSRRTPGYLTCKEFIAFFEGRTPRAQIEEKLRNFNAAGLKQVLLKIHNQSLNKVFQEMDQDRDGLLNLDDLIRGLVARGVSKAVGNNRYFREYVEFFINRRKGLFTFNDFRRFINCRGRNPHITEVIRIPADHSIDQVLMILQKNPLLNIADLFDEYDLDDTKKVNFPVFKQVLNFAGYELSDFQFKEIFSFFARDEQLDYVDFALAVTNSRSLKGKKILQAPGGTESETDINRHVGLKTFVSPGGYSTFDFGNKSNNPLPQKNRYRKMAEPGGVDHLINASPQPQTPQISRRGNVSGPQDNISQWDTIGEITPTTIGRRKYNYGTPNSQVFQPDELVKKSNSKHQPGGKSNLDSSFNPLADSVTKLGHKGMNCNAGRSVLDVNFVSMTEETSNSARKIVNSSVRRSNLGINFTPNKEGASVTSNRKLGFGRDLSSALDYDAELPRRTQRARGEGRTKSSVDLSFDSTYRNDTPARKLKGNVQIPGGKSNLSASMIPMVTPKTGQKKIVFSESVSLTKSESIVKQFEKVNMESNGKSNMSVLETVAKAIEKQGRLRRVFRSFNISDTTIGLSKEDFRKGLGSLGVALEELQVDNLYSKFDKDQDGVLTYSEFVRMHASARLN